MLAILQAPTVDDPMTRGSRGPKDHVNIRISLSDSKAHIRGIPKIMCCSSVLFMWS